MDHEQWIPLDESNENHDHYFLDTSTTPVTKSLQYSSQSIRTYLFFFGNKKVYFSQWIYSCKLIFHTPLNQNSPIYVPQILELYAQCYGIVPKRKDARKC
jgi:hypothetical protein